MKKNILNLQMFAGNPNTNTTGTLSNEMRTYYSDYIVDYATPNLVHDQFGQKQNIPEGGGNTIHFRKFSPLPKVTSILSEGVTPDGGSMNVSKATATLSQYGYYLTLSDVLTLTSIDNTLLEATQLLGKQAGQALDNITREVINGGTNVIYAGGSAEARELINSENKITVEDIYKAARFLKNQNAPKIDGGYVAIIHPDVAYDLMRDPEWIDAHKYSATTELFEGEIGKIAGIRFVETTEAKIFQGNSCNVYSTLVLGANAYGVTELTGGGLQTIIKQLGSGGAADPLNQRATCGWKALKTAVRLVENYLIRIESASTFNSIPN